MVILKGNGQLRVKRAELDVRGEKAELDVPHLGETLTFTLPLIGPIYHKIVMNVIDSQKLYRPTTAETLSLVDLAFQNSDEQYCAEILKKFKNNYLWTGTESLSFSDGVLVYDNIDGKMPQNRKGLLELLDAKDEKVRFVQPGFETGHISISKFLKHPYVIAQIGENMIETAERVAKHFNKKEAYVFGLDKASSDTKRFTAIYSYWNGRLNLSGDCRDDRFYSDNGWASGVC